jgi:branched-chain amino acid transport system substrate-binding protein
MGLTDIKVYGRGTVVSNEFLDLTGDPSIWNGAKEVNRWAPQGSEFEKKFEERWGHPPELPSTLPYYAIQVLVEAIELAGSDDRAAIRDALEQLEIQISDLGPVNFDDHNQAHTDMFITQFQDGKVVTLERRSTSR